MQRPPRVLRPPLPGPRWLWIPPMSALRRAARPRPPADGRRVGVAGIALVALGAAALALAFTVLDWRNHAAHGGDKAGRLDFGALRDNLAQFPPGGRPGAAVAYFNWLCWALLAVVLIVGVAANLPRRGSNALRLGGLFLGMVGAAFTYYALSRYSLSTHDLYGASGGALDNAATGTWLGLGGFLLAGIGAARGPRPPKRAPMTRTW